MNVICNSNTNVTIQERKIHARMDSISRSWVAKKKRKKDRCERDMRNSHLVSELRLSKSSHIQQNSSLIIFSTIMIITCSALIHASHISWNIYTKGFKMHCTYMYKIIATHTVNWLTISHGLIHILGPLHLVSSSRVYGLIAPLTVPLTEFGDEVCLAQGLGAHIGLWEPAQLPFVDASPPAIVGLLYDQDDRAAGEVQLNVAGSSEVVPGRVLLSVDHDVLSQIPTLQHGLGQLNVVIVGLAVLGIFGLRVGDDFIVSDALRCLWTTASAQTGIFSCVLYDRRCNVASVPATIWKMILNAQGYNLSN